MGGAQMGSQFESSAGVDIAVANLDNSDAREIFYKNPDMLEALIAEARDAGNLELAGLFVGVLLCHSLQPNLRNPDLRPQFRYQRVVARLLPDVYPELQAVKPSFQI